MKTTKKALLSSIMCIILCMSMLVGTTFAWFTDTVSTGANRIQSGILKVDMEHKVGDEWVSLKENPEHEIISSDILWEPGYTALATVRIVNKGNLALKYRLSLSLDQGVDRMLADVIDVYACVGTSNEGRPDLSDGTIWEKMGSLSELIGMPNGTANGILLPAGATPKLNGEIVGATTTTVVLHMREDVGNEYQNLNLGAIYMELFATQYTYEEDSFDDQYDAGAKVPTNTLVDGATLNARIRGEKTAAVQKIVFGCTAEYTDVIANLEGINVDEKDQGTIKLYRDGATVYILSDKTIFFNANSDSAMRELTALEEVVTANTDFSQVVDASAFFYKDAKLKTVDVSGWDVSSVVELNHFFYGCAKLTEAKVEGWNTSKVTTMKSLFAGCAALTEIPVENWNTSSNKNFSFFFSETNLTELDLQNWDTSNATNMSSMFQNAKKLQSVNLEGWDTSKVTNFGWLFQRAESIKSVDLSSWDVSSAKQLNNLFCHAHSLETVNISTWDVSNVENFENMLQYTKVAQIDVSGWVTSSATTMSHMFANNSNLTSLDLGNFDTSKVTDMQWMFYGCESMKTIYVGEKWTTDALANKEQGVFSHAWVLTGQNGTTTYNEGLKFGDTQPWSSAKYAVVDTDEHPGLLTLKKN